MEILKGILDLLYPPKCVFCGKILDDKENGVCHSCRDGISLAEGKEARSEGNYFQLCVSPFYYEGAVRESILRFKFGGMSGYAGAYAGYIAECIKENIKDEIDVMTWVPISRKRLRQRGYDQARLLCESVSQLLGMTAIETVVKVRDNEPQSGIDGAEKRRANVIGVYEVPDKNAVEGKTVLIIDDIHTTGSTLSECARTLLLAGAESVFCATIAKTRPRDI